MTKVLTLDRKMTDVVRPPGESPGGLVIPAAPLSSSFERLHASSLFAAFSIPTAR
jgi:hypothetical protein